MSFGERLKALRRERGFSQAEVAAALGMSQTNLSALERQTNAPRETVMKKLADYYGVSIQYFIHDARVEVRTEHRREIAREYLRKLISEPHADAPGE